MNLLLLFLKIIIITGTFYLAFLKLKTRQNKKNLLEENEFIKKILESRLGSNLKSNFFKLNIPFNIPVLLIFCIAGLVICVVGYFIIKKLFVIKSVAFILAIPLMFTPFFIVNFRANKKQENLEFVLNDFFIQLKGQLRINPDIIDALKKIQNNCMEPFREYLKYTLREINSGIVPEEALKKFAKRVDIKRFYFYIENLKYCNIYGGDVNNLTIETQELISDLIKQKKKRIKETKSICLVLYMLIGIDLLIYFAFIIKNATYFNIIQNSNFGSFIVNINFLSIWLIVVLSRIIRKLDF